MVVLPNFTCMSSFYEKFLIPESDIRAKRSDIKDRDEDTVSAEETENQLLLQEHIVKVSNMKVTQDQELLKYTLK